MKKIENKVFAYLCDIKNWKEESYHWYSTHTFNEKKCHIKVR